jgi:hypothetical protein
MAGLADQSICRNLPVSQVSEVFSTGKCHSQRTCSYRDWQFFSAAIVPLGSKNSDAYPLPEGPLPVR